MKRENEIGALLGLAFAILGITIAALLINIVVSITIQTEVILIVSTFLFFAAFFGARAGRNIIKKQHPIWIGFKSTFLTTFCTLLLSIPIYILFDDHEYYTFSDVISVITVFVLYTVYIGTIPILIVGCIYGYALRKMVRSNSNNNH